MREIKMQYPLKSTNKNYDGKIHTVLIENTYRIGNKPLFLMNYYDRNLDLRMCTILLFTNGSFYKMPLKDYDNLGKKIKPYGLNPVSDEIVTPFVQLGRFVTIEELLTPKVAYNNNNNNNSGNNIKVSTNGGGTNRPPLKFNVNSNNNNNERNIKVLTSTNTPNKQKNITYTKNNKPDNSIDLYICYNYDSKEITFTCTNTEKYSTEKNNRFSFSYIAVNKDAIKCRSMEEIKKSDITTKAVSYKDLSNNITKYRLHYIPYFRNIDNILLDMNSISIEGPINLNSPEHALFSAINGDHNFVIKNITNKYSKKRK